MFVESLVKIIPSIRDPLGRVKVESPVHHPIGTILLKETYAGSIYRMSSSLSKEICWNEDVEIPEFLNTATKSVKGRKSLVFALNINSKKIFNKECNEEIGKPNSAFAGLKNNCIVIDHLFENETFGRGNKSKLHDIMRDNIDYAREFQRIQKNMTVLSGHLAPFNISTKSAAYIMLLDHFAGQDAYKNSSLELKYVIRLLYGARIVPITSDGHLINLDSKNK
jgi:hypothetical protein